MDWFNDGLLLAIVLAPLIGAALNGIGGCFFKTDKKVVSFIALGSVAISFVLALLTFAKLMGVHGEHGDGAITYQAYEWFSVALADGRTVPINVRFTVDALSGIMLVMVTGIGLLIHIYSTGYMSEEASYARFFSYLNLFMASMLILILASNIPLMFVGWEGVGLCSYLLIGFWFENPTYAAAGKKAFIVNRIGDFGVLMGMFILLAATGSFEFTEINRAAPGLAAPFSFGPMQAEFSIATIAVLFLFLGCTGKSAQIPLYIWLPDAMAGPTPVSALIHAATMVTSGVYLACRLSPVFVQSPTAMAVITIVGTLTAVVAASIALVQNQLKKVLAYSTVSQLGFMFAAVGVGAFSAGIFHVFTHAFFKACLFLGAGSVMHAVHAHGDADLNDLGGMKKWMPITNATFLISCGAIAGFPLTSGFFSKDMILHGAWTAGEYFESAPWLGQAIFGALALCAFGTAFYMFRLYFLTFTGEFRGGHGHGHGHEDHGHDDHGHHAEPHESEAPMAWPLIILAVGAIAVGFLGMPAWAHLPDFWNEWLHGVVATIPGAEEHHHDMNSGIIAAVVGTIAGLGGIGLAWSMYKDKAWHSAETLSPFHQLLMDKWRVDELYQVIIVGPLTAIAKLSGNVDRIAVDGLTKVTAGSIKLAGWLFTRLQNGVVHAYGTAMAAGLVGLTWWVLYPHPHIDTAVKGDAVHFVAGPGLGYEYRWDFDSDGEFDTEWSKDARDASYAYKLEQAKQLELTLVEAAGRHRGPYSLRLDDAATHGVGPRLSPITPDEELWTPISTSHLGDGWRTNPHSHTPPSVRFSRGKLFVRPGASDLRVNNVAAPGDEVEVEPGSTLRFGEYAKVRVDAVVQSTLAVRSVFGNVATTSEQVVIEVRPGRRAARAVESSDEKFAQRGEQQ
ncbi:MAG: NADH-quinone oxidoreductase subunit L [Myxococcales bacterium]